MHPQYTQPSPMLTNMLWPFNDTPCYYLHTPCSSHSESPDTPPVVIISLYFPYFSATSWYAFTNLQHPMTSPMHWSHPLAHSPFCSAPALLVPMLPWYSHDKPMESQIPTDTACRTGLCILADRDAKYTFSSNCFSIHMPSVSFVLPAIPVYMLVKPYVLWFSLWIMCDLMTYVPYLMSL